MARSTGMDKGKLRTAGTGDISISGDNKDPRLIQAVKAFAAKAREKGPIVLTPEEKASKAASSPEDLEKAKRAAKRALERMREGAQLKLRRGQEPRSSK